MFEIRWEEKALSLLKKLDPLVYKRIINKIDQLKENPFSKDVKKLRITGSFRLRVGDYRVIFDVQGNTIRILSLGHRKNIYRH
jgi:mRNA interferase RelE/StbE